jgi:hypothetical protein
LYTFLPFGPFGIGVNLLISHMPALFVSSATYRTLYYPILLPRPSLTLSHVLLL